MPASYASLTRSASERNHAHTESEALAIIFGTEKFPRYLYDGLFNIVKDHQPLRHILIRKSMSVP